MRVFIKLVRTLLSHTPRHTHFHVSRWFLNKGVSKHLHHQPNSHPHFLTSWVFYCPGPPHSFLIVKACHLKNRAAMTSIQGQVPNKSKSEKLIILHRSQSALVQMPLSIKSPVSISSWLDHLLHVTPPPLFSHIPCFKCIQNILLRFSYLQALFFILPPYGFLLFSLLLVFFLQEYLVSLIPGVVQVLSYQAVVGSQAILFNILEKAESFLLFGAHHSSSISTAFWGAYKTYQS